MSICYQTPPYSRPCPEGNLWESQLKNLRAQYRNAKYIPLRVFLEMIDLECKLRPVKLKR